MIIRCYTLKNVNTVVVFWFYTQIILLHWEIFLPAQIQKKIDLLEERLICIYSPALHLLTNNQTNGVLISFK